MAIKYANKNTAIKYGNKIRHKRYVLINSKYTALFNVVYHVDQRVSVDYRVYWS